MSANVKTLTAITAVVIAITASSTAFSKERGHQRAIDRGVVVKGHDRIMYPPVVDYRQGYYQKIHRRQFNDRQYLRMQKYRKMKRKICRIRRLNNAYRLERPIIIVTRPLY